MASPQQLWWKKYRKRQLMRLNLELVLRKSFSDAAKEYASHCGIAGIKEIHDKKTDIRRRLVYVAGLLLSCGMLLYVLRWTKAQTFSNPLVVTQESSTYPIKSIDFPAIALCNVNRISARALHEYATEFYNNLTAREDHKGVSRFHRKRKYNFTAILHYMLQYGKLIDFSFTEDMLTLTEYEEFETPRDSHRIVDIMKLLSPRCDEMLLRCAWAGQIASCKELFTVRRTAKGHCCVFNYVLSYHSAGRPNRTTLKPVKRQNERGPIHGLHVVLDPLLDDYAYPLTASEGFDIFLFDPTNYPDPNGGRVIHRSIQPNEVSYLELQSVKQLAAPEIKYYPKSTRKCLFYDESKADFGDMYSYSTCIVNCRIKTVRTLCKCTPYFLPIDVESGQVCTLERLRCLNKYKEKLLYQYPYGAETFDGLEMEVEDSLSCPECLPDCEFTQHYSRSFKVPNTLMRATTGQFKSKEHRNRFTQYFNLTNKCILSVFQSTGDGDLNRLDVMSYWFEILSNVGGYAGILIGFSIISAMEVLYFIMIRFPHLLSKNYRKYY